MSIVTVVITVSQAVALVWIVAGYAAKLDKVADSTARIEKKQDQEAADNKIWKAKIEADIADLKVRTALLEARVNSLSYEK